MLAVPAEQQQSSLAFFFFILFFFSTREAGTEEQSFISLFSDRELNCDVQVKIQQILLLGIDRRRKKSRGSSVWSRKRKNCFLRGRLKLKQSDD